MQNTRLLVGALALTALSAGLAACRPGASGAVNNSSQDQPSGMSSSAKAMSSSTNGINGHGAADGSGAGFGQPPGATGSGAGSAMDGAAMGTRHGQYVLQPMPTGTVSINRTPDGKLSARVDMFGLTPGSAHQVSIGDSLANTVQFPPLTANAGGQADTTLTSLSTVPSRPALGAFMSRFIIRLDDTTSDPMAAQPIAEALLPPRFAGSTFPLNAVTVSPDGQQRPSGRATISYNPAAQALTVTVTAFGLNRGPHAAHIHLGSCQNQGAVQYMLADFIADNHGNVINESRTVTGVASIPPAGNWYLNLHQGGGDQILANGTPTLLFRPLLCTNISSIATTGRPMPPPPSGSPTSSTAQSPSGPSVPPTQTMPGSSTPAGTPTATMPTTTSWSPTGGGSSSTPTDQPTTGESKGNQDDNSRSSLR